MGEKWEGLRGWKGSREVRDRGRYMDGAVEGNGDG